MLFSEILRNSLNYEIRVALWMRAFGRGGHDYNSSKHPLHSTGFIFTLNGFDAMHLLLRGVAFDRQFYK